MLTPASLEFDVKEVELQLCRRLI